ncbi:hypothetical protein J2772_000814 [Chryseobacterium jejuense]|nr:hypothetical protein [Chryseobacterium jejuense]
MGRIKLTNEPMEKEKNQKFFSQLKSMVINQVKLIKKFLQNLIKNYPLIYFFFSKSIVPLQPQKRSKIRY